MSKTYYMQHSLLLTILLCVNLIGDLSAQAFNLGIAIVDLNEERNSLNSQLFSAEHMVKVACVPYVVTHNVDDALAYSVVLFSSKMTKGTLSENLNQQITAYVENGGTLIVAGLQDEALVAFWELILFN
jgi:hypothetical protein